MCIRDRIKIEKYMMSYWVLFIGIAVVSWLVQMNLQKKFKKYSKTVSYTHLDVYKRQILYLSDERVADTTGTYRTGK